MSMDFCCIFVDMDFNSERRKEMYWELMVDSVNKRLSFISSSSITLSILIGFMAFYADVFSNSFVATLVVKIVLSILFIFLLLSHYIYYHESKQGGKTAKEAMEKELGEELLFENNRSLFTKFCISFPIVFIWVELISILVIMCLIWF